VLTVHGNSPRVLRGGRDAIAVQVMELDELEEMEARFM